MLTGFITYAGFNILLGKTMHSLLVLTGVLASTTSFILATITCGGARHDFYTPDERRTRLSVIFDHNADDAAIARPITPWEYPPPSKEPLSFAEFPSDPPPLYQERESDISSNLWIRTCARWLFLVLNVVASTEQNSYFRLTSQLS